MSGQHSDDDFIEKAMTAIIAVCKRNGFVPKLPMEGTVSGGNGIIKAVRWSADSSDSGESGAPIPLREPGASPINIVLTDARNESAVVVIGADGSISFRD